MVIETTFIKIPFRPRKRFFQHNFPFHIMKNNSLFQGLTSQMIANRISSIDSRRYLFLTYFPLLRVYDLIWSTRRGSHLQRARNLQRANGEIPLISIRHELGSCMLRQYQIAFALRGTTDATQFSSYWGADIDLCFHCVQGLLEYISWKLVSNAGVLSLTSTPNFIIDKELNLDYGVDDGLKMKTSTDWGNPSGADVIGDLVKAVHIARERGLRPRFAFTNMDTFRKICSTESIIKSCAPFVTNSVGALPHPLTLQEINTMLAARSYLYGLQLRVIDAQIPHPLNENTSVMSIPFDDDRLVLSENELFGSTQYDILEMPNFSGIHAIYGHTVIKKFCVSDPYPKELTIGQATAIPVLETAYRNVYLRTDAKAW